MYERATLRDFKLALVGKFSLKTLQKSLMKRVCRGKSYGKHPFSITVRFKVQLLFCLTPVIDAHFFVTTLLTPNLYKADLINSIKNGFEFPPHFKSKQKNLTNEKPPISKKVSLNYNILQYYESDQFFPTKNQTNRLGKKLLV